MNCKNILSMLPAIFVVCICILSMILPSKTYSVREKRYLMQRPDISLERVLSREYQKDLETYYADQFPFRDHWFDMKEKVDDFLGVK